jgi:hypothetical protein
MPRENQPTTQFKRRGSLAPFPGRLGVQPPFHRFGLRRNGFGGTATPYAHRDNLGFGHHTWPADWFHDPARGGYFLGQGSHKLFRGISGGFRGTQRFFGDLAGMTFVVQLVMIGVCVAFGRMGLILGFLKPLLPGVSLGP